MAYAVERYQIMLARRQGLREPWTSDPILREYRFCNVFREDDRTTAWIREHIREPLRDDPKVLMAMVVARWFNRIETLERIEDLLLAGDWNPPEYRRRLKGVSPLVTGAYMVKTPPRMSKLEGIIHCINAFEKDAAHLATHGDPESTELAGMWEVFTEYPYLGPFMAYEIVTDLRHTYMGEKATDIMTWCSPGPGCARGLGRVMHGDKDTYSYVSPRDRQVMLLLMNELLPWINEHWDERWPRWEMRELEHTLCEFDKYERARLGEGRPKQKFKPVTA